MHVGSTRGTEEILQNFQAILFEWDDDLIRHQDRGQQNWRRGESLMWGGCGLEVDLCGYVPAHTPLVAGYIGLDEGPLCVHAEWGVQELQAFVKRSS